MTPAPTPRPSYVAGQPRFEDPQAARLQAAGDLEGAWLHVMRGAPASLAGVKGSFAVALRDERGRWLAAVDRFATVPLCFRVDGETLHCAARADALAHAGSSGEGLDAQALYDYLYFHSIPSPRTVFSGVQRLPAGHLAVLDGSALDVRAWWTPRFDPRPARFEDLRDEFRTLLAQAVRDRVNAAHPACFLSGGTDSSTVAGLIAQASERPAQTYSIGFDAQGYDEMAYARIAARHFGTEHHEYYVSPDDLVAGIPGVARHYDQPFGNSSALPAYYCALQAKGDGVERMLAGDGGDELFGGNSRYAMQRVFGWWRYAPAALRRTLLEPLLMSAPVRGTPLLRKGAGYVEQARTPMPDRLQMYNLLLRLGRRDVLTPAFLAHVDEGAPLRQQREVWNAPMADDELNRTLAFDWRYTLAESDLPKVSMTTQLAGVDVAYPMLDDALVDFSLRLPVEHKLKGLKLRWFFKEALRGFLPDEILTKKKQGFGLPFGVWALQHEGLRKLALESLGSLATRNIVNAGFIRQLVDVRLPEHPRYFGEMVWILMMLEQWLQARAPRYRIA
jgi:asparagine synthase (glutamine-hydrolysing)